MEPEGSVPCSQGSSTGLYPEPDQSCPCHPILSLGSILILSTHLCLRLPSGLFPSGFPTNILYIFLSSPFVLLHALPISSSLTLSFSLYLVKGTSYEAPHYVVFSSFMSLFDPNSSEHPVLKDPQSIFKFHAEPQAKL
jgi:hypothetical protein